jgi:hypothetical protein
MKQRFLRDLSDLPRLSVLRFRAGHFVALLFIAIVAWFSSLVMAEFDGDDMLEQTPDAITWPMLPGESLNQLAALFYPGNKSMQRRFVAKTQELSRELNPTLDANAVFSQPGMLVIPELKALSRHAPPFNSRRSKSAATDSRMSYQIEDVSKAIITSEMHAQYEELSQRNFTLKQELESLNLRLSSLQSTLDRLKILAQASKPQPKPALGPIEAKASTSQQELTENPPKLYIPLAVLAGLALLTLVIRYRRKIFKGTAHEESGFITRSAVSSDDQQQAIPTPVTEANALKASDFPGLVVEEAGSVVEEAKIFVDTERSKEAIALLQSVINEEPEAALEPWLYLLDIYRDLNQKEEFAELAQRFHRTFNVMTPLWEEVKAVMMVAVSLEEFPHIISQLVDTWPSGKARQYLENLLVHNRDGDRTGFSLEILQEILLLLNVLETRDSIPD